MTANPKDTVAILLTVDLYACMECIEKGIDATQSKKKSKKICVVSERVDEFRCVTTKIPVTVQQKVRRNYLNEIPPCNLRVRVLGTVGPPSDAIE